MKKILLICALLMSGCTHAKVHNPTIAELECMTENIYFEARGEPIEGQALVAQSVINRMHDKRWKNSICGVVHQAHQYSWTKMKDKSIVNKAAYDEVEDVAYAMLRQMNNPQSSKVNHYLRCDWRHKVKWWKSMKFLGQVGDHCFYEG